MARIAKSLETLRNQVNAKWPGRNKASDGWIGDAAHAARDSDHNPDATGRVDALDITHDPSSGCDCQAIADAIRASRDHRVSYLIFNERICSSSVNPWTWRKYTGSNPHDKHLHISVNDAGADDASPWAIDTMPLFETKAPGIMNELIPALGIDVDDAAAILGNLGHESDGFRAHQEYGHTGSSGGIGWAQWTGSRRNDFENWSAARGLDVRSDEANLGFLIHELTNTSEKRVLPMMRATTDLREKTNIFCDVFERPNPKVAAHDNRYKYALRAKNAYAPLPVPVPEPIPPLDGSITPDDLLASVRPKTVTVRDTITSQIEGFPKGVVETTYVRQSVRFIPDGSTVSGITSQKGTDLMNFIMQILANFVMKAVTANGKLPDGNWKSLVGFGVAILMAVLTQAGIEVPIGLISQIAGYFGIELPTVGNDLIQFIGILLGAFGLGNKAGKPA